MKNLLLSLSAILFFHYSLIAQKSGQNKLDSLLLELPKAKDDSNKVNLLIEISFNYAFLDTQEGINYGTEALAIASKINFTKGIAASNLAVGVNNNFNGNYEVGLEYLKNALSGFESIKNKAGIAKTLLNIGSNYQFRADFPKALEYNLKALKINEETNNKKEAQKALNNIGNVYFAQFDFEKALDYYTKALEINKEIGYKKGISSAYGNIGLVYEEQKNYTKAIEFNLNSLEIDKEIANNLGIATNMTNLSGAYSKIKNYEKALEYGYQAVQLNEKLGAKREVSISYGIISKVYFEIANDSNQTILKKLFNGNKKICLLKAKDYTIKAIALVEGGDLRQLYNSYAQLSEVQSQLGDNIEALESYKKFTLFKDSVFNIEKNEKITETNLKYEFDKKETIVKIEQEKKDIQQINIRNFILIALIATLLFSFYIYQQRNKIAQEQQRSEALLLNILPAEVAEELKANGKAAAQEIAAATVLFTDIQNFTQKCESMTAAEIVAELDFCFSAFDQIIAKYPIEKIKTVGDAYVCASGLPHPVATHATDIINAGINMQSFMEAYKKQREAQNLPFFEMRLGINSGNLVAGIVGIKKFAYDIWGDTVNLAARMEQSGEIGKINISENTYQLVKADFNCVYRGKIEAKNKGEVNMYFVESSENFGEV